MTQVTAGTWQLDPTHTEVGFSVRHLMSKVRGRFTGFEGTIVTADDPTRTTVSATIQLATVVTGNEDRDNHLRSSDFFSVEESPEMTFVSTSVVDKGDDLYAVSGDLSIKGVTRPVELSVELTGEGGDPWGGTRIGVEASGEISRKEFGVDFNIPVQGDRVMIGDRITISISAEAVLQTA